MRYTCSVFVFVREGLPKTMPSGYVKCRRPTKGKLKLEDQKGGAHVPQRKISKVDPIPVADILASRNAKDIENYGNSWLTLDLSDGFFSQLRSCMLLERNLNSKWRRR